MVIPAPPEGPARDALVSRFETRYGGAPTAVYYAYTYDSVNLLLDAIEAAIRSNGDDGRRHHLAHLQVVDRADVPRFAALGAGAVDVADGAAVGTDEVGMRLDHGVVVGAAVRSVDLANCALFLEHGEVAVDRSQ